MIVKPISENDLGNVVRIHLHVFKNFFLSEIGDSFLNDYYLAFLRNNRSIFLGCYEDDALLGFCAASKLSKGFNISLLKQSFSVFALQGIKLLFSKPKALIRLIRNFSKKGEDIDDEQTYAELYSIAVSNEIQGRGVGKILLNELETILRKNGCDQLSLTTDNENNNKTLAFYKSAGYEVLYKFKSYPNREMFRLIKNL